MAQKVLDDKSLCLFFRAQMTAELLVFDTFPVECVDCKVCTFYSTLKVFSTQIHKKKKKLKHKRKSLLMLLDAA